MNDNEPEKVDIPLQQQPETIPQETIQPENIDLIQNQQPADLQNTNPESNPKLPSKEFEEEEENLLNELLFNLIDNGLTNFHSSMFTTIVKETLYKFLNIENKSIFVWIEGSELIFNFNELPDLSKIKIDDTFQLMYLWKREEAKELDAENFSNVINSRSFRIGRNLSELIDDISINLIPQLINDKTWPENVRKDLLNITYKFVCTLTELQSQRNNKIILYIPNENLDQFIENWNTNSQDHKDICARLECVLMHWVKQIKDLLNSQSSQNDNDSSGLIEEVQFWNNCRENLVNLRSQLQNKCIKKVLSLLSFGNSNHIASFESLSENIVKGATQAEDNLKFLRVLEKPCQQINSLSADMIPSILQSVFYSIRMLWQTCGYYSSEEKVAGLFRKVSNQIIKRCSETINLNDLFEGNVESCITILDSSIKCLKKWREIYDKNTNAMKKNVCWKFGADSIFAQIEAFIQRCYDLKEICEGQIQFARKGIENQMPIFSSSKNDEILAMLDEIKESFQKQLLKLSGANKERILDIKSTKWHEDYNVFKTGMKNLDNLYTNLITFAFENIFTVQQAVESMIGFKTIARRDSIVIHVSKKIERVNELIIKEFHNMEQLAKLPPSNLYRGKLAARSMWHTGLMQRLQSIKKLYEKLYFVEQFYKDQVETEYVRIENFFKVSIANNSKDFKENAKDLETTLSKRLDQNILIEGTKHVSKLALTTGKTNAKSSDSKEITHKKYIECNFDKTLLTFIIEVDNFKKLSNQNVQSNASKIEEFFDAQKEKLLVYRKNVMLVVMDYNYILEQTSDFENELFMEHIENINSSIYRGLKILRWSSQGTLDNFVKECRSKCEMVSEKIDRFKQSQSEIEKEIRSTFSKLKFINFDSRKVQEFSTFVSNQSVVMESTHSSLKTLFNYIATNLEDIYANFIEKGEKVQSSWVSFLKKIDKIIEEEFRHQFKFIFQELLKAITGDEKSKTNPTQIFKLHIILKSSEQENKLDFEPTLSEFQNGLSTILIKSITNLISFVRLPHLLLRSRERKIAEINENMQKESKNDKAQGQNQGYGKKFTGNFFEIPIDWVSDVSQSYLRAIEDEVTHIQSEINKHIKLQCLRVTGQLEPWKKNCFLLTGSNDYSEYTNFIVEKNTPVANLRTAVEYYDVIQTEIQVEKTSDDSICIQIDTNKIKKKLIDLNYEEQKMLLNRIKEKSIEELRNLTKKFIENEKELIISPTDLKRLKESMDLWGNLYMKKSFIEESLGPLEEKFKLLDDYMIVFKDDETRMRLSIKENFERFYSLMDNIKKRNDNFYQMHHNDHLKRLQDFEQEMRDNRLKLLKEMPTKNEPDLTCEAAFSRINTFKVYLKEVRENEKKMEFGFELFNIHYIPIPEIALIEEEIKDLETFWGLRKHWDMQLVEFLDIQFYQIDTEQVLSQCKSTKTKILAFPKSIQAYELTTEMIAQIDLYIHNMQLINMLKEEYLRERHWKIIKENVKENFDINEKQFTLSKIMDMGLENLTEQIKEVCETAFSESKIENLLNEIIVRWEKEEMEFELLKFSSVKIISNHYAEKVEQFLEEDLVQLSSLKSNAYAFAFARQIELWDVELNRISEVIDLLMVVQKKFVYFNNIFGNLTEDIGQLIGDKNIFNNVKINLLGYLNRFETDKNTRKNLLTRNFKDVLSEMTAQLDTIQKHMKKYLEKRKYETPRFYFLSDEDIFEILGKAKDPMCLHRFLKKMFEGIRSLDFHQIQTGKGKMYEYIRIVSPEEERLDLYNKIEVNGDLNYVVQSIEREMVYKLKTLLFECINFSNESQGNIVKNTDKLEKLLYEFPGQVLLLSGQLSWTNRCFQALLGNTTDDKNNKQQKKPVSSKDNWATLKMFYSKYIVDLISIIRRNSDELVKKKLIALITLEVHNKDVLETLSNCSMNSFEWLSQLRYQRFDEGQDKIDVKVEQFSAKFDYSFEYQGNNGRLVVTPLTDRCYLSLTNAMHFKRGGNPQGPAGTGKTETVKDLGKNLGRFVFVFNCSEGLDVKNMKNMFEGLAQTGFWGCFDEFNRIEIEVLSVIAIQINSILEALAMDAKIFNLEEKEIHLNKSCALFITMNPGYAGRSELPDNLKSLFRPISMIVPDSVQICRIAMQAEGFKTADFLSKKLENLYALMKQTLSNQNHYDFGLRDIKSVLTMAGELRRKRFKEADKKNKEVEGLFEQNILLQAFYTINEPKLVSEDLELFEGLLNDLFPEDYKNARCDQDEAFIKRIDIVMDKLNLDKTGYFVEKITQFYYTKSSRHGTIVIGKSMTGKSTLMKVLNEVQNLGGKITRKSVLNPKVLNIQELYGFYNQTTDESVLGVFSHIMDQFCNKDETTDEKWIVLDGPIDTMWIENMNSLLDDNKVLTLVDGNRINLKEGVKVIFEVDELTQASPATVSRCGIVFMDEKELNWQSIRTSWILVKESQKYPESLLDYFDDLFDKWLEPLMVKKASISNMEISHISESAQVRNLCRMFEIFMSKMQIDFTNPKITEDDQLLHLLEKVFVFCIIWTVGSNFNQQGKTIFDNTLRDIESILPFSQTIFDYFISLEKGKFILWEEKLSIQPHQWKPPHDVNSSDFLVETVDTARIRFIVNTLLEDRENIVLIGPSSIGKTILVKTLLKNVDENLYSYNILNLTTGTTSSRLQESIEGKLSRTTKKKFRPFSGKKGFVFVDDLALPKKDKFGYQPTLELLRQVVEYNGWYDRSAFDLFVQIKEVNYIAAIREGQTIPNRLLNKLFVLGLQHPNDNQLRRIYSSILYFNMSEFDGEEIKSEIENLVNFVIGAFKSISTEENFISTPLRPHYIFSLKDITRVIQGISMIDKINCDSKAILLKLGFHENMRVFEDKMITQSDRDLMRKKIIEQFDATFDLKMADLLPGNDELSFVNFVDVRNSYACVVSRNPDEKIADLLKETLENQLQLYNKEQKFPINIAFFTEAIFQICKMNRIFNMQRGHMLLIGEPGTGKHTLVKLAGFISQISIQEQKNNNAANFRTNLKGIFENTIYKNTKFALLFDENETKIPEILLDINSLLSLGEIPNLFVKKEGRDDFSKIRDKIKIDIKKENEENIFEYFLETVQNNMHIVFCTSRGEGLRYIIRDQGGFVYNTTQIYFDNWPQKALQQVALAFLSKMDFSNNSDLAEFLSIAHSEIALFSTKSSEMVNRLEINPKVFIDFEKAFETIYERKSAEIKQKIFKYQNGIEKLEETQKSVEELKSSMDIKRIELHKKKKECEEMIFKIDFEKRESAKEKKNIEEKDELLTKEKEETMKLAGAAKLQLEKAEPILVEAKNKVKDLDNNSIAEIKVLLKTKDKRLELIMFSLMILLGEKAKWDSVQKIVTDANFLKKIREMEMDKIDEPVVQKLEQYTQQPEIQGSLESFSRSVNILATFIKAVEVYVKVNLDVKPIRDNVIKLNKQLEAKEEELQRLKDNLVATLERLESLNNLYDSLNDEYQLFLKDYAQLEQRLERAEKLVAGLSFSYDSWLNYLKYYTDYKEKMIGNILLSAAFLNYYGLFSFEGRKHITESIIQPLLKKKKIVYSSDFSFVTFLADEVQVLNWNFKGLPNDMTSLENAVIVQNAINWPYIIDPQLQCINWLKNLEGSNKLILVDYTTQRLTQIIEKAVADGAILVYQHANEELASCLQYLLKRTVKKVLDRLVLPFGEKEIAYNPSFKFYITSRITNPILKQQITSKVTLINFTVVQKGLEEQFLGLILRVLDEKLETQRIDSIKIKSNCETILRDLEDRVLEMLKQSDDQPLVDSEELIETLQTSKEKEEEIKATLEITKLNFKKISHSRESYRALGTLASTLYFAVSLMEKVNYVYQFSLESYFREFEYILVKISDKKNDYSDSLTEKTKKIDSMLRTRIYKRCCEFLFEKDRLLLAFLIAITLAPIDYKNSLTSKSDEIKKKFMGTKGSMENLDSENAKNKYYEEDFRLENIFFMNPYSISAQENQETNPDPLWISQSMWDSINQLNTLSTYQGIIGSFLHNTKEWKKFFLSSRPETETLPSDWSQKIKKFSLVLLIKVLRPDRLLFSISNYVKQTLGQIFVEPCSFNFEKIYKKILKKKKPTPILIILGNNVDPFSYVDQYAKKNGIVVHQISLGQGQLSRAKDKIQKGIQEGFWVYLGNIHLSPAFIKELDLIIELCRVQTKGFNFQLIMTSKPSECLSLSILQNSYKAVIEPVKGVKSNLIRIISNLIPDFKPSDERDAISEFIIYRKLCYSLCWLHSVLNERKRFRSLGWNISYEFSDTDLVYSEKIIYEFINSSQRGSEQGFQWDAFRYLIGQINYGGRVTDQWDIRLLNVIVKEIFTDDMMTVKEFNFCGEEGGPYKLPPNADENLTSMKNKAGLNYAALFNGLKADMLNFVQELPDYEPPEVFGQHINAEITMRIEDSNQFIEAMTILEMKEIGKVNNGSAKDVNLSMIVEQLIEGLHAKISLSDFSEKIKHGNKDSTNPFVDPITIFFLQESKKFNSILDEVRFDLSTVQNCLKGRQIITEDIEQIMWFLNNMRLPPKWKKFYPSIKPLNSWMEDLNKRIDQIVEWNLKGNLIKYWLGGFIYPNGFLTAVLQTTARKTNFSIDNLKWDFQFFGSENMVTSSPKDGVYVIGMFLEGGSFRFSDSKLIEADPMTLYAPMPVIHFRPVEKSLKSTLKTNVYICPVYIYPVRKGSNDVSSYLFTINLPFVGKKEISESFWIKRGTALLLSLNN